MSLDLYIISKTPVKHKETGVWVRENGQNVELSPEKCKELYPDQEFPLIETEDDIYWHGNITHNLTPMATHCLSTYNSLAVSLKTLLWHPEETGLLGSSNELTKEYIQALSKCLDRLKSDPDNFSLYNPKNKWGSYDTLVNFVERLIIATSNIEPDNYKNYVIEADR